MKPTQEIQFIEEIDIKEQTKYYTHVNGLYADGSLSFDKAQAHQYYKRIVENGGTTSKVNILETTQNDSY